MQISASERFGKILDVLKQRTRSEQLVGSLQTAAGVWAPLLTLP